jgi:hypothetical protein
VTDLIEFLRARLDEVQDGWAREVYEQNRDLALYLLRSVEAKRHLLATLRPGSPVLSILAYEWVDHPDYDREHWATETDLNPDN